MSLFRSGLYAPIPHATRSTASPPLNRLFYSPFVVARARTFDRLAVETTVAASAGGVLRVGVYADAASFNWPGSLVAGSEQTIDATVTAGLLAATVNLSLAAGVYWFAVVAQVAAATCRSISSSLFAIADAAPTGASNLPAVFEASVSGSLPATANPSSIGSGPPLGFLRAA